MKGKCNYDVQLLEGEELKEIPGFPRYKASNLGRIFSYTNEKKPKILKPGLDKGGYPQVALVKDGRKFSRKVSRIVGETWLENTDNKPKVEYISDNKLDTRAENLRWVTPSESCKNKLIYEKSIKRLQRMSVERSQMVYAYNEDFEIVSAFTSTSSAARECGYSQGNISSCCQGSLEKYKGLIWNYSPNLTREEREKQVKQGKEKYIRNRISTSKAVLEYRNRPENREKARKKALDWYYQHKEYVKIKRHNDYMAKKQKEEDSSI